MSFNALSGRGNYAYSGSVAANDALRSFIAQRKKSPDYGRLVQEAEAIRSREKIAKIKAEADVARVRIRTDAAVEATQILDDAEAAKKKDQRKAGLLAAAGQRVGVGMMKYGEEPLERRDSSSVIDRLDERIKEYRRKGSEITDETPINTNESSTNESSPVNTSSVSSSLPGKATNIASATSIPKLSEGWARLRRVLSTGEGTLGDKGYTTRFGGGQFQLGVDHPRIAAKTPWGTSSAAAGKYQIMPETWDTVVQPALNLPDFSVDSQEKAGRYLTQNRGVNPDKVITNFDEFKSTIDKLAPEWASLPYSKPSPKGFGNGTSYYGQGGISLQEAWKIYNQ